MLDDVIVYEGNTKGGRRLPTDDIKAASATVDHGHRQANADDHQSSDRKRYSTRSRNELRSRSPKAVEDEVNVKRFVR